MSMTILGDNIRYHWKIPRSASRELRRRRPGRAMSPWPKRGATQKGCTNSASGVKKRSMVRRCSSGVPWHRDRTTCLISCSGDQRAGGPQG